MDKAALQAMLSDVEKRHSDLISETHRLEGEYRLLLSLINKLDEGSKPQEGREPNAKTKQHKQ